DWAGEQINLHRAAMDISIGNSEVSLQGQLQSAPSGANLTLNEFGLNKGGQSVLALEKPALISINHDKAQTNSWSVRIGSFAWRGSGGQIQAEADMDWPVRGGINLSIQKVASGVFADFLKSNFEPFEIQSLKAVGTWTNSPVLFAVEASATVPAQGSRPPSRSALVEPGGK